MAISAFANNSLDRVNLSSLLVAQLKNKSFSCVLTSEANGYRCRGKLAIYPDFINYFIPVNVENPITTLAIHFHGFNICGTTACHFNLKDDSGNYGKFLSQKSRHSILVVPESQGNITTYSNYFKSPIIFDSFVNEVISAVQNTYLVNFEDFKISSHSGSDRLINLFGKWQTTLKPENQSQVLQKVNSIALFDSLYAYREHIPVWISKLAITNPKFRFLGSYIHNSPIDRNNAYFYMQWLQQIMPPTLQIEYYDIKNSSHFGVMRDGYMSSFLQDD